MALTCCINKDGWREYWKEITDQSFDSRLQTFLDMVDKSTNGQRFSEEEVKEIINLSASANKLSKIPERAEDYASLIMEELDPDNLGYIELSSLKMLLVQASLDSIVENQKLFLTTDHNPNPIKRGFLVLVHFLEDNWKRLWVTTLWFSICAALFTWKFVWYTHFTVVYHVMGYCVPLAKGIAETLKFNMALIVLLVCKNTITWLRSRTKLGIVVPFDDNINFHMVIALIIGSGVTLHTLTYLICIFPRFLQITNAEYEPLKPYFGDKKPNYWLLVNGIEGWTGIAMLLLIAITYILAHPWFRRNKLKNLPTTLKKFIGFNAFWYTHHLYVIMYVLLIIHGYFLFLIKKWSEKTTWMYLVIPVIFYACERLLRLFRSGFKSVRILKVVIYPDHVLELHVPKPQAFKYIGGQYIYVNCPDVSTFEWHPFSITSAPGDDNLSFHVQTLGDWTSQLKDIFAEVCQLVNDDDQCDVIQIKKLQADNKSRIPRILIDGPYGAPAQEYKNYEFLLLVGLGIGVTPLISILKDVLNNIKQQKDLEEGVIDNGVKNKKRKPFATKRAYFYWFTRYQGSLEWFKEAVNEAVDNDMEGVIELHNYCSSVYEEGDAQSAFISWLQSRHYDKKGVDIVSRTRIKTYSSRPNWHNVFKRITIKHPDKRVGVLYCGTSKLAGELQRLSLDFSRRTNTKFDFHKENF